MGTNLAVTLSRLYTPHPICQAEFQRFGANLLKLKAHEFIRYGVTRCIHGKQCKEQIQRFADNILKLKANEFSDEKWPSLLYREEVML